MHECGSVQRAPSLYARPPFTHCLPCVVSVVGDVTGVCDGQKDPQWLGIAGPCCECVSESESVTLSVQMWQQCPVGRRGCSQCSIGGQDIGATAHSIDAFYQIYFESTVVIEIINVIYLINALLFIMFLIIT